MKQRMNNLVLKSVGIINANDIMVLINLTYDLVQY